MRNPSTIAHQIYQIFDSVRANPNNLEYDNQQIINLLKENIVNNEIIRIILPAFHGKSNNRDFVISHLPDYGDYLGIKTLVDMYEEITKLYNLVEIILLHEGHFHAEVELFGNDQDVKAYMNRFRQLIQPYKFIKSYCINELISDGDSYCEKRTFFLNNYCPNTVEVQEIIKQNKRFNSLYLAYKKLYSNKVVDMQKNLMSCNELRNYSKQRSLLQLRKYIGFDKLVKEHFSSYKYIKLSWVYKDVSVTDQISIKVIGVNTKLGTPGFFSIITNKEGCVNFVTKKQAIEMGASLKMYYNLPYYVQN